MSNVLSIDEFRQKPRRAQSNTKDLKLVVFNRSELDLILQMYGKKVIAGEFRDYTLDFSPERASFSCIIKYGRIPDYHVVKWRKGMNSIGRFGIVSRVGKIIRCGSKLSYVLNILENRFQLSKAK